MPTLSNLLESLIAIGPVAISCVVSLLLYPLARFVLPHIKSRAKQAAIHLIIGLLISRVLFGRLIVIPIGVALISYFLIDGNPLVCAIFGVVINSATCLYEKLKAEGGWEFAISCIVMVQFEHIVATTVNLSDGRKIAKGFQFERSFPKRFALSAKPSLLEWFAYMFTPFGAWTGPFYEFKLFEIGLEVGIREHVKPGSLSRQRANTRWLTGLFWLLFNVLFMKYGSLDFYTLPIYLNSPWFIRHFLSLACTTVQACRYWPAWDPVDAGISELGLGENEVIENRDDISNLSLIALFKSESINAWLRNWNHSVHIFWKRYLFYPLKDSGWPYMIAFHTTFVASALWHGFEPVYFFCLPEMVGSAVADDLLLKYVIGDINKLSTPARVLYGVWIVSAMFTATSTWWYRSYDAFWYVRKSNRFTGSIVIFVMLGIMLVYSFFVRKRRKGAPRKVD